MIRVALIAYLSLTMVLGPLLCCCNAQQLLSTHDGPKKCCGKSAAPHFDGSTAKRLAHNHHHPHSSSKDSSKSDPAPAPDEHDGQNCPCGKHHANLVATAESGGIQSKVAELPVLTWHVALATLSVRFGFDTDCVSMIAKNRPAILYGREILRAYQVMRC